MTNNIPNLIKIYHIVHISKLPSIIDDGFLYSDAEMRNRKQTGATIGMERIKNRRLSLALSSHPGLYVGECVPFYFCPRSIMLYLMHMSNSPDITYRGGQEPIIHLVADFHKTVEWANDNNLRWAFTTSNAGAYYFDDYSDLSDLTKIDWQAIQTENWREVREKKQAEFLIEHRFPWELVEEVGVYSYIQQHEVQNKIGSQTNYLKISIKREWYY